MLAEKYRPYEFGQVIGQEKTIRALQWYLDAQTGAGKAFLLTGPSGSGKTTLAYCAARYWGVQDQDIRKIEAAEIDVDTLRQLASDCYVYGSGAQGRRAYILDEIHTTTARACDRLLSLLEGLPKHVLLVATTTEADWTGGILASRFTKLALQKINSADVARYLQMVAAAEKLPLPDDANWAEKLVKYGGLNLRDQLNQLPARLIAA